MCYSAQIWQNYQKYVRAFGADIDVKEFVRLYWDRQQGRNLKIAKAMDAAFAEAKTDDEQQIKALIDVFDAQQATQLESELFKQKQRLNKAERDLQAKPTKKAAEDQRIATNKIQWSLGKLADLRRPRLQDRDSRIFPGWYAPVMVMENGRRVLKPMRYQCRPAGKPALYDSKFPGTYNARRDNLGGFWKGTFGVTHGLMVANAFYENVSRHRAEGRELAPGEKDTNVVLEFRPRPTQDMLIACLWSRWVGADGTEILSFAAITDDPPAEVAAAGHDRCIIPVKPEHLDAWLQPDPADLAAQYAILDDRARPYFEHRMAA